MCLISRWFSRALSDLWTRRYPRTNKLFQRRSCLSRTRQIGRAQISDGNPGTFYPAPGFEPVMQNYKINGENPHEFTARSAKLSRPHDANMQQDSARSSWKLQLNRQHVADNEFFSAAKPQAAVPEIRHNRRDEVTGCSRNTDGQH